MKKLKIKTAKVRDLFKEAMSSNNDKTSIIGASGWLIKNPGLVDMDVPVEPTRKETKKMMDALEKELQNNSTSASSVKFDLQMVKDESIDLLFHRPVYLYTEKAHYDLCRSEDGMFTVEYMDHRDFDIKKADNTILDAKSSESSIVHRTITIKP